MDFLNKADKLVARALAPLNNKTVSLVLTVFLILYSGLLAGSPPDLVRKAVAMPPVRVILLFLLAFVMSHGDRKLAMSATVAVLVTLLAARNIDRIRGMVAKMTKIGVIKDAKDLGQVAKFDKDDDLHAL